MIHLLPKGDRQKYNAAFPAEGDFSHKYFAPWGAPEESLSQKMPVFGPRGAHQPSGSRTGVSHAIPGRTGAPLMMCGHALAHSNSQRSTFYFASQCRSSRSSSAEEILCSVAQQVPPSTWQSVFGSGSFCCGCRHCSSPKVLHAKVFNSA